MIEHIDTMNVVCPYCGWVNTDSWELKYDRDTRECPTCEKTFEYERDVMVSYSTKKAEQ